MSQAAKVQRQEQESREELSLMLVTWTRTKFQKDGLQVTDDDDNNNNNDDDDDDDENNVGDDDNMALRKVRL